MNVKTKKAKNQVNVKNSSIKVLSNEEISRRIEKIEKNRGIVRMCEQVAASGNTLILYSA